jgi:predicted DNA-binding protein (UPF0278 family)
MGGILMPKVTVELDWETVDNIVLNQLQDAYSGLVTDLEEREGGGNRGGIFDSDKDKDIILIKAHIDAFALAVKYFGGKVDE